MGIHRLIALALLFLAGKFIVLTFLCKITEETLVSQQDTQNSTDGDGCLLRHSMNGDSKPDMLHKCMLNLISIPESAHPFGFWNWESFCE